MKITDVFTGRSGSAGRRLSISVVWMLALLMLTTTMPNLRLTTEAAWKEQFRPGYENLSVEHKKVYDQMMQGISNFEPQIKLTGKITDADFKQLFEIIGTNALKYHYLPANCSFFTENGYVVEVKFQYTISKKQAEQEIAVLEYKIRQIIKGVTSQMNEFEQLKYIHDTIIKNCSYTSNAPNPYTAYGALVDGRAVCEGYSKAMAILCTELGVDCLLVSGYGRNEPHMWNMVKYDDEWYHLDVTWDDPTGDFGAEFVQYDYFNLTERDIERDHQIIGAAGLPRLPWATARTGNYFVYTGTYASSYEQALGILREQLLQAGNAGRTSVMIKLANDSLFYNTYAKLFSGEKRVFELLYEIAPQVKYPFKTNNCSMSTENNSQNVISIGLKY